MGVVIGEQFIGLGAQDAGGERILKNVRFAVDEQVSGTSGGCGERGLAGFPIRPAKLYAIFGIISQNGKLRKAISITAAQRSGPRSGRAGSIRGALSGVRYPVVLSPGGRARRTQNSLPSGSAMTTQDTSGGWPMSMRRAPRLSSRCTSAAWSSGRRSR